MILFIIICVVCVLVSFAISHITKKVKSKLDRYSFARDWVISTVFKTGCILAGTWKTDTSFHVIVLSPVDKSQQVLLEAQIKNFHKHLPEISLVVDYKYNDNTERTSAGEIKSL